MRSSSLFPSGTPSFPAALSIAGTLLVGSIGSSCNLDPVHSAEVNRLGDEQEDRYPAETEFHRPGEPCAVCHSDKGPADSKFVLAGTVYWGPDDPDRRVDKAYVHIADADNNQLCVVTNCNGNFFVRPEEIPRLTFPVFVRVERTKDPGGQAPDAETLLKTRPMQSHIGREPSCAACHQHIDGRSVRDFASPGQIRLYDTEAQVNEANPPITVPCGQEAPRIQGCFDSRLCCPKERGR